MPTNVSGVIVQLEDRVTVDYPVGGVFMRNIRAELSIIFAAGNARIRAQVTTRHFARAGKAEN